MLPLTVLQTAVSHPLLVELKSGDTYNGRLASADSWMNLNLVEVICTSADGEKFWKLPSVYIRGSAIKYLRLPPALLEQAAIVAEQQEAERQQAHAHRGGAGREGRGGGRSRGGRGRGRGEYRGGGSGRGRHTSS